jgi:uncharacterized glyoxalase superfamily protein PhnB
VTIEDGLVRSEEDWTDRGYEAEDLEGHHWWVCQRLRDPKSTL